MKILALYLKNFQNHKETNLDFRSLSAALIVGKHLNNEKVSNGVGKTTIFNGIEFILFNKSHSTTLDKIVKDGKNKAIGAIEFEEDGEVYKIYRHRTKSGSSNVMLYRQIDGEYVSISGRTASDTEIKIKDIIKISHKAFVYSVLFRQADLTGISSVTDVKKRKEILKEPLNLAYYSKLEDIATKKARPVKKKIDELNGSISVIGNPKEDIDKANKDLEILNKKILDNISLTEKLEAKKESLSKILDNLNKSLNNDNIVLVDKLSSLIKDKESIKRRIEKNKKQIIDYDKKIDNANKTIKLANKSLDELVSKDNIEILSDVDFEKANEKYSAICSDEIEGNKLITSISENIRFTKNSLPSDDVCPSCKQNITKEYRQKITSDYNEKITKLKKKLSSLQENMDKCLAKKKRFKDIIADYNLKKKQIQEINNRKKTIKEEIKNKEEFIKFFIDGKEKSNKEITDDNILLDNISEQIISIKTTVENSNDKDISQEIDKTNIEIKDISNRVSRISKDNLDLKKNIGVLEERINIRTTDSGKLVNLKKELQEKKIELKLRKVTVDAFSHRGAPTFIINTILNDLQFEVNNALKELRPELSVKIDSDLNFEYRRNGVIRDYEQLSHGQHVYIALAFKRGMANIINNRLNVNFAMMNFDEIDSHLDEAGVEALADAIKKWQKKYTIFVITHNKDLKDKFSHAILIEEDSDGAQGRIVNSW